METLRKLLQRIDGKGYKAYKDIQGNYNFTDYSVAIDHVQGDPFAAPSRISINIPMSIAGFPASLWQATHESPVRRIALEDYIARYTKQVIKKGGPGGGFILSSSNSIHASVKPENYMAMLDTLKKYGSYPLSL